MAPTTMRVLNIEDLPEVQEHREPWARPNLMSVPEDNDVMDDEVESKAPLLTGQAMPLGVFFPRGDMPTCSRKSKRKRPNQAIRRSKPLSASWVWTGSRSEVENLPCDVNEEQEKWPHLPERQDAAQSDAWETCSTVSCSTVSTVILGRASSWAVLDTNDKTDNMATSSWALVDEDVLSKLTAEMSPEKENEDGNGMSFLDALRQKATSESTRKASNLAQGSEHTCDETEKKRYTTVVPVEEHHIESVDSGVANSDDDLQEGKDVRGGRWQKRQKGPHSVLACRRILASQGRREAQRSGMAKSQA